MNHLVNFDLIILFFILGAFASWIKSDLQIPQDISRFLSIFLLLSLGLKGGHEVRSAQHLASFFPALFIGIMTCVFVPIILFYTFKKRLGVGNASALSAAYGSVSAVTFVTAQSILANSGLEFSGYMVAVMALMEIPAIIVAMYLYQRYSNEIYISNKSVFKSILTMKSVVLLLGGFAIGISMNQISWSGIAPVIQNSFKGVLAFFLLDLGYVAQKQLSEAWEYKLTALCVAWIAPLIFGSLTLILAAQCGVQKGDQILLAVLAGSASYIAAPAAIRSSVPDANPSLYLALPLALTFPMNLIFGIPFYTELSKWIG